MCTVEVEKQDKQQSAPKMNESQKLELSQKYNSVFQKYTTKLDLRITVQWVNLHMVHKYKKKWSKHSTE